MKASFPRFASQLSFTESAALHSHSHTRVLPAMVQEKAIQGREFRWSLVPREANQVADANQLSMDFSPDQYCMIFDLVPPFLAISIDRSRCQLAVCISFPRGFKVDFVIGVMPHLLKKKIKSYPQISRCCIFKFV